MPPRSRQNSRSCAPPSPPRRRSDKLRCANKKSFKGDSMASTSATTALPDDLEAPQDAWLVIGASSLGTVFEWYDFYLYGLLAVIISAQFFSGVNDTTGFIFALAAFGAGVAVRPL